MPGGCIFNLSSWDTVTACARKGVEIKQLDRDSPWQRTVNAKA